MMGPLVTIGVPVYNGEKYLAKALDALLVQDYENIELVISDNGSTDRTPEILRDYVQRHPRIQLHSQPKNIGAIGNFRAVLDAARGKYFMWAAVDDHWYPSFVSKAVAELEAHPDAGVVMSAIDRIWEDGSLFDQIRFVGDADVNHQGHFGLVRGLTSPKKYNLFVYGLFKTPLLRRAMEFVPQVPAWERLLMCQIALSAKFRYVDEVLHARMQHPDPVHIRLPEEEFNKLQTEQRWVAAKIIIAYAKMIAETDVVPLHRKLYAPMILQRYGWLLVRSGLVARVQRQFDDTTWQRLQPVRSLLKRALVR